jgi:hypothetical protein
MLKMLIADCGLLIEKDIGREAFGHFSIQKSSLRISAYTVLNQFWTRVSLHRSGREISVATSRIRADVGSGCAFVSSMLVDPPSINYTARRNACTFADSRGGSNATSTCATTEIARHITCTAQVVPTGGVMKHLPILLAAAIALASCTKTETYPLGTDVTVAKSDGASVSGRLVEVKPDRIVIQNRDGLSTEVLKSQIASLKAAPVAEPRPVAEATSPAPTTSPATAEAAPPAAAAKPPATVEPAPLAAKPRPTTGTKAKPAPSADNSPAPVAHAAEPAPVVEHKEPAAPPPPPVKLPEYRDLTIPSGTTLSATLATPLASDTSKVEDTVRATLKSPVSIEGFELVPAGATIVGHVTKAEPAAKVKGRAFLAFRFSSVDLAAGPENISSETISREAAATKGKDAAKIGVGAGAGAVIGGIIGGGSGAATGAAIGGGAGTATVLATKGDEVRLPAGTPVSVKLTSPLTIRVEVK